MSSAFSLFKQKVTETFVKDAKTTDPEEFLDKLKEVWASEGKINFYIGNVNNFVENMCDMLESHKVFAETMYILYQNGTYEP
jgi:hypothetical protein